MNIGIFAGPTFRPHAEHLAWLGQLAAARGHRVVGLSCDGASGDCYARALLQRGRIGCVGCSLAGLRAYPGFEIQSARGFGTSHGTEGWSDSEVLSSVRTILREEDELDLGRADAAELLARLGPAAARMYAIVSGFIERNRLDAMLVFNGRMDITRAAIRACRQRGIGFATVERASFDTGLRIMAMSDCNAPRNENRLQELFRGQPLLESQAAEAAEFIARRVMRMPVSEWRTYNQDRRAAEWPDARPGTRILVGPSSQYEVRGEEGWELLGDMRDSVDRVVSQLGGAVSVVVRGHPVWAEQIAGFDGGSVARYYREWCARRGYVFIEPESNADTRSLVLQADIVIATGGTIGIEAACAGRPVLTLAPCYYRLSGAVGDAIGEGGIAEALRIRDVPVRDRVRQALRSIYTHAYRTTQFCRYARPVNGSNGAAWEYREGASFEQVERSLAEGFTVPDDTRVAADATAEERVVDWMLQERWGQIIDCAREHREAQPAGTWRPLDLSLPARVVLSIRGRLPKGDRMNRRR
jgi:hypothetical protein